MSPPDEGDHLYMPPALSHVDAGKAAELLEETDRLIKTKPQMHTVLGKAGRAETATDLALLEMFGPTIEFMPRAVARQSYLGQLLEQLQQIVKVP